MADMPRPNKRATVQLPRHSEPRDVIVRTVHVDKETAMVEYPGTSLDGGNLFGNIQEEVEWSQIDQ